MTARKQLRYTLDGTIATGYCERIFDQILNFKTLRVFVCISAKAARQTASHDRMASLNLVCEML